MFNGIIFKGTRTFIGKWKDFHFLSHMMKQTHTWGFLINSDTETDTKETYSKLANVQ